MPEVSETDGTLFACRLTLRDGRAFWCSTSRSSRAAAEEARGAIHGLLDRQLEAPRVVVTCYAFDDRQLHTSDVLVLDGGELRGARIDVAPLGRGVGS